MENDAEYLVFRRPLVDCNKVTEKETDDETSQCSESLNLSDRHTFLTHSFSFFLTPQE